MISNYVPPTQNFMCFPLTAGHYSFPSSHFLSHEKNSSTCNQAGPFCSIDSLKVVGFAGGVNSTLEIIRSSLLFSN